MIATSCDAADHELVDEVRAGRSFPRPPAPPASGGTPGATLPDPPPDTLGGATGALTGAAGGGAGAVGTVLP